MHQVSELSKFSIGEITKVEGSAGLDVEFKDGKVESVKFKIQEFKRFYTEAIKGKPISTIPQLLARICGTCSNAHLLASVEAVEHTLGVVPSEQSMLLRNLLYHGLIIRDHALHLYIFAMPDLFGKDSFLEFDENDPLEHDLLHDAFAVKAAGNHLAIYTGGRSVHAPFVMAGGFAKVPDMTGKGAIIDELKSIRPAVLRLIQVFLASPLSFVRESNYFALVSPDFSYLEGKIHDSDGLVAEEADYRNHLEHVVIPYSEASGYQYKDKPYRVGALARLNLNKDALHERTKSDAAEALKKFPSHDVFHNNLAQAIGILHSIDVSIDLLEQANFTPEKPIILPKKAGIGVGVIEAPRGTLYHKLEVNEEGVVVEGEIIVPTGQNQITIEYDLKAFLNDNIDMERERLSLECERIIRAYDPCMSCASHFLTVNWGEKS
jgi:coenzyme F420-reducing hydrogenase alpha subunit